MRILFAGTPQAALPTLKKLHLSDHEIVTVITRPDAPSGRGKVMTPSPVAAYAEENNLSVLKAKSLNEAADRQRILDLKPDLAIIVAYGSLIREPLLSAFPWINLHFSLLPSYRGAAPVQHAILNGEEITGVTAFCLDQGLDTGPIVGQVTERISPQDTSGSLMERLTLSGADLIIEMLNQWSEITPQSQSSDGASFAPKVDTAMARIDWSRSAEMIDRHIRAMIPAPGPWTTWQNQRVEIGPVALSQEELEPGRVLVTKHQVLVGTGSTALLLTQVKPEGRRAMSALDWARGLRDQVSFA